MKSINKKENIFNDGIAYVENWDFSRANLNNENRIHAITLIASICYQNPKALNSDSLYNRLMAESSGLPSSAFEFVSILLNPNKDEHKILLGNVNSNVRKFGEWIEDGKYLLTNYRAVVYDCEERCSLFSDEETINEIKQMYLNVFNTEEECKIIERNFVVIKNHIDLPTFGQYVRHRINWQVVSRRYVSGKKMPFEFYISEKMKDVVSKYDGISRTNDMWEVSVMDLDTQKVIDICLAHYFAALDAGVKPEEARRIIPQAAYTTAWCAMQPKQLENFLKLRLDSHAQKEIRLVAESIEELLLDKQGE
jgi:thymidylate synthase (FAD)